MRILLKCPTRSRPNRILDTLRSYIYLAQDRASIGIALSCDEDDTSMAQPTVQRDLSGLLGQVAWNRIFFSNNKSKIAACNANMNDIDYPWDIVVLVSDDMVPRIKGWDVVIRMFMKSYFPDTNGILWFNDGYQADKLNTLCIYGRKFYDSQGYIYHPEYKSLFCDTELTDRCRTDLAPICKYIPYVIIRHEHPGTGFKEKMDPLYARNQVFWNEDLHTYIRRKVYPYDWSILIPTIPGRDAGLARLVGSIREKVARICPALRYQLCISFDNKESSIGMKRQGLLEESKGKYLSFIDDDDDITDAYIEDLWEMIQGGYHTMRIRGQMSQYTFVHTTEMTLSSPMATMDEPPVFQRPPNHLNPMVADAAKLIPFKNAVYGEDLDWTLNLYRSKCIQTEYRSDASRIHYIYDLGERVIHPETVDVQRSMSYETMLGLVFTPSGEILSKRQPAADQGVGPRQLRLTAKGFVSK
jgi:hypothetical protein